MELSTTIPLDDGGWLTYSFWPATGEHLLVHHTLTPWPTDLDDRFDADSRGAMINHLAVFRGNPHVDELVAWLSR